MAYFTRTVLLRLALSVAPALAAPLACHAADAAQKPAAANAASSSDAELNNSLNDLFENKDDNAGQATKTAPEVAQPSDQASQAPVATDPTPTTETTIDAEATAPVVPEISKAPDTVPVATIPASAPQPAKTRPSAQIEEIIVTATKREESLREIPQSITAFAGEALEKSGIQSVDQIVRMSPGVNFVDGGQQAAHVTIRGISSNSNGNQTTGTIFGNVSLTDPYLQIVTLDPNPFDLKSVEILKGPQGTLFGAGGFGGAIRYVPEGPKLGVWETKYFAEYTKVSESDKGAPIYGAATNVPIGDTFAARLVGIQRRDPGYYDDTGRHVKDSNTLKQNGLRGALAWQPTSDFNVNLLYAYQTISVADMGYADNADGRLTRGTTAIASPTDNKFQLGNLTVSYAFDWATATSETSLIKKSVHFIKDSTRILDPGNLLVTLGIPGLQLDTYNDTRTVSQEFRLTSPSDSDSPWKWVTGVFGSKERYAAIIDVPFGPKLPLPFPITLPPPLNILTTSSQINLGTLNVHANIQELALFGEVTRQLGDDWALSLGARAYRTKSGGLVNNTGLVFTGTTPTDMDVVEKGISPKVSLTWHATEDIMNYATVSRGYRVGGVQPGIVTAIAQPDAPRFFKSDSLMNYEVGTRTSWLDNTLHADAAVYYLVWKNPQTNVASTKDGLSNYFTNVGGVKGKGIEASIEWLPPIEGVAITFGGSFNRTTTTVPFALSSSKTVAVGSVFPQSPKWQTATTLAYAPDIGDWKPSIALTHTYLGKAIADFTKGYPVFGYQQYDLNLSLANPTVSWLPSLSLIGSNIFDKRGVMSRDGSLPDSATGAYTDVTYIRPRAITLRINGRF